MENNSIGLSEYWGWYPVVCSDLLNYLDIFFAFGFFWCAASQSIKLAIPHAFSLVHMLLSTFYKVPEDDPQLSVFSR